MPLYNPAFVANGEIFPARFVKISAATVNGTTYSADFAVVQCGVGDDIIGVSQEGSLAPPGIAEALVGGTQTYPAATLGKTLKIFGLGDVCVVTAGTGGCTAGSKVKSDADGKAVNVGTTAGTFNVGGIALQTVNAGEKCLIQVNPHQVTIA